MYGGLRHAGPYIAQHHTAPTGRLATRRRAHADHSPGLLNIRGTPLPRVRCPGPACPQSLHPDIGRSPVEWRLGHMAAPRSQIVLLLFDMPTPHLHRATAWPRGTLGTTDLAVDGTAPCYRPGPGWGSRGSAQPALRPHRESEHAAASDPPHPLPRNHLPSDPQRGRFRAAEASYVWHCPAGRSRPSVKMTLSVRRTCVGGGLNAGTPRLWYNDSQANSGLGGTDGEVIPNVFLRSGFVLATTPGPGPKQTIDVSVDTTTPCPNRPFTPFGTWSVTLP
jgi:hypothetical protein